MPDRDVVPGLSEESDGPFLLSPRQGQVLALAAQGFTHQQIGLRLALSPCTVRAHLARARERLGALNTTHAVALALALGVISMDIILEGIITAENTHFRQ